MELKSGKGNYEGKEYTYLYVDVVVNGVPAQIKLKCSTTIEKNLLLNEIEKKGGIK